MIRVIDLLKDKDIDVFVPAMRVIGNVLSAHGDDNLISMYIGVGLISNIQELFTSPNTTVQKEVLWILSNLLAGPSNHILEVVKCESLLDRIY